MTFGSLFAGIGGFDLGFERAGMKCVWQVEIDEYCRRVLAKHWPHVPRWDDVRTFTGEGFERPDVICGGFPCQDISNAGRQIGIEGERSGLWSEYARIIRVVRPRFIVVENVDALAVRGLGRVLGDLASLGFDAEWTRIPAASVGAPHIRWRIFIVAYANGQRPGIDAEVLHAWQSQPCRNGDATDAHGDKHESDSQADWRAPTADLPPDSNGQGLAERKGQRSDPRPKRQAIKRSDWWATEPDVGRVAHGVPARVDRLRGLGNAVVPQVAEWIGRRLMESVG